VHFADFGDLVSVSCLEYIGGPGILTHWSASFADTAWGRAGFQITPTAMRSAARDLARAATFLAEQQAGATWSTP